MKKILILGGTVFVGRSLTEQLVASGKYDLTLFNRGKSNTDLFKGVKQIHGDRESADVEKLYGQYWDCIIDFSAYYPVTFKQFLDGVKGNVGRYIFISTISVFDLKKYEGQLIMEDFERLPCTDAQKVSALPDAYGEKKAEMERLLLADEKLDKIIFRPSYIYGKHDPTERFYYWLYRVQNSDRFLLPDGGVPLQLALSNAADLARALLQAIEIEKHATVYHAVSTSSSSVRQIVEVAAKAYGRHPEVLTTDMVALEKAGLKLNQFPLVLNQVFNICNSLWQKDFPFERTDLANTLLEMRDYKAKDGFPKPKVGLDIGREQEIISSHVL